MKIYRLLQSQIESKDNEKEKAVATMIVKDGYVLILKRGASAPWMPNMWNLPGGVVENDEQLESAAIRECFEETGITPSDLSYFKSFDDKDFTLVVFTAKSDSIEVNLDFENSDYTWVNKSNYNKYDYVPYIGSCIATVVM